MFAGEIPVALADALLQYITEGNLCWRYGIEGRAKVEREFSLDAMVNNYLGLYDAVLARHSSKSVSANCDMASEEQHPYPIASGNGKSAFLKSASFFALNASGINFIFRKARRTELAVFCYHGVVPADRPEHEFLYRNAVSEKEFRRQMDVFGRKFRPVSMKDLLESRHNDAPLPKGAALITFDDGYHNNYLQAAPILKNYGIPAAFFVATGYIGTNESIWANEVDFYVLNWQSEIIPLPVGSEIPLPGNQEQRYALAARIRNLCKRLPEEELKLYLALLSAGGKGSTGEIRKELFEFMNWDEVSALHRDGFYIGSHSASHPILTRISPERLNDELISSKRDLELHLHAQCECIAYPNGQVTDFSQRVINAASEAGYVVGFTLTGAANRKNQSNLAIHRVGIPGAVEPAVFDSVISGTYAWLTGIS